MRVKSSIIYEEMRDQREINFKQIGSYLLGKMALQTTDKLFWNNNFVTLRVVDLISFRSKSISFKYGDREFSLFFFIIYFRVSKVSIDVYLSRNYSDILRGFNYKVELSIRFTFEKRNINQRYCAYIIDTTPQLYVQSIKIETVKHN